MYLVRLLATEFKSKSCLIKFFRRIHDVCNDRIILQQFHNTKTPVRCSPTAAYVRIEHVWHIVDHLHIVLIMLMAMKYGAYISMLFEDLKKRGSFNCVLCPLSLRNMNKNEYVLPLAMFLKS